MAQQLTIEFIKEHSLYLRPLLTGSLLEFSKLFALVLFGEPLIVSEHHVALCKALQDVAEGKTRNLIVNLGPGYSKSLIAVIMFSAWSLARNNRSKMLHTSYSDDLASLNSSAVREIVSTEEFQILFNQPLKLDSKAKKRWFNHYGGGMYATASNGPVTGFRAGQMSNKRVYSGALIIDDPVKPAINNSLTEINSVNERYMTTLRNRLAHPKIPIIIIMQRLDDSDLSGFLLRGGTGETWDHLELPANIDNSLSYPKEYTHGRQIQHSLPDGPLWEYKNSKADLRLIELSDPYTYNCQYLQRPQAKGGNLFNIQNLEYYSSYNPAINKIILETNKHIDILFKITTADTAFKTGERNDFSVFQLWGLGRDNRIYLLDQYRGKVENYDLEIQYRAFLKKHEYVKQTNIMGIRDNYIEDKASGTGLIQVMRRDFGKNYIKDIQRNRDKISRFKEANVYLVKKQIVLPRHSEFTGDFVAEMQSIKEMNTHKHDDEMDAACDSVDILLIKNTTGYIGWV